ncbi:MAG: glycosyltransferase [Chloroflexota bacterium]
MTKKILIVYENAGAGHKRVAEILQTILCELDNVQIVSQAASDLFDDDTSTLVNRLWNYFLRKNWIRIADALINFFLRLWVVPVVEVLETTGYLNKLEQIRPDMLICTYDAFGKVLGTYAREKGVPFYLVLTEISVFIDLVNPEATHICYFPETINAIHSFDFTTTYFTKRLDRQSSLSDKVRYVLGMYRDYALGNGRRTIFRNIDVRHPEQNDATAIAVGPLVEAKYYVTQNRSENRTKLMIAQDQPCLLIISGSIGGAFIDETVRIFQAAVQNPLTILAVCGHDHETLRRVEALQNVNPSVNVIPLGFVDNLEELYSASDVVVARPSAGVLLEALRCHSPLITAAQATANDLGSIAYIQRHQLGEVYEHPSDAPRLFYQIIDRHQHYVNNISERIKSYPSDSATLASHIREIISSPL